jgi:FMN phosphatase YigB (HAD superfamily)
VFGRSRFAKLVDSQLDVFLHDRRDLVEDVSERLDAYNRSDRAEAEELYGDYVDAVDNAVDALAEMRDHYARSVDDPDEYVRAFDRAVARRLPEYAAALQNR